MKALLFLICLVRICVKRIKEDIENKDYDSVIAKSRTLLEEVLIFIIEKMTFHSSMMLAEYWLSVFEKKD